MVRACLKRYRLRVRNAGAKRLGNTLRKTALLFVFILIFFTVVSFSGETRRELNFAGPEDVFSALIERVAAADFGGAMELFCYREQAERFDVLALSSLLGDLIPPERLRISRYGAYAPLNETFAKAEAADSLSNLVRSLLLPAEFHPPTGMPYLWGDDENKHSASEIIALLDPRMLAKLKLIDMRKLPANDEERPIWTGKMKEVWGYDERRDYKVLYQLDESYFVGGLTLFRYGERWLVSRLDTPFLWLQSLPQRNALPVTREQYETAIDRLP